MNVYNPKTLYHAWPAFYAFVDFLVRMIDEDKVEVKKNWSLNFTGSAGGPAQFEIWLSKSNDIKEESKISFGYRSYKDVFVGTETPIRRFEFGLISSGSVLFQAESRDPKSYDKMLELFRAVMRYTERHDPKHYWEIFESICKALSCGDPFYSMDRKNWLKSKKEIEKEFNERYETKRSTEDFERKRSDELSKLTNEYKSQGYEIIE